MVYENPGLQGLEIWQSVAGGVPLSAFKERKPVYFQDLRKFLICLHQGEVAAGDDKETEKLKRAAGFQRVVLCGGEALNPSLEGALKPAALPFAVEIDTGGPYSARRGALRIFQENGWRRGLALDLGQLQLKVMTAVSDTTLPRDLAQLPFGTHSLDTSLGRARIRDLIEAGVAQLMTRNGVRGVAPDGIVLALPVALGNDGVAEPATYPGLFGPVEPIFSGLFDCPCVVVNDAVLAGVGFPPRAGEKTLVVTLGFGIGAALWM